ncbi:hypothetical protein OPS25_13750 [Alteromonas ponticola]|uniref:MFS transporter n=1 Tax=Alteromonas aquimaris TaxID=2998417 RepID=A0ABT3P9V9_9ALTE|nr:hypothetical protein [Alteromonas aquimaris]MCW8109568.1 hypothetical protein [Alteromonas aquimaris]
MRRIFLSATAMATLLCSNSVFAQTNFELSNSLAGHFFISLIAGVMIAVGIQFLLSNLAIALGITAIGDVRDYENTSGSSSSSSSSSNSDSSSSTKSMGRKVTAGLGLFTTITMSISLFVAVWLATDLSMVSSALNGAILGLVVWAFFFLLALMVDVKLTTAICGNLVSLIQKGLAGTSSAVAGVFSTSDESKARSFAKETVKAIHDEVKKEFDTSDLDSKIKQYIDRATSDSFSAKDFRKELEKLIDEIEVEEQYVTDDPNTTKKLILDIASNRPSLNEEQKKQLSSSLDDIKASIRENDSHQARATAAFDKLSPGDEEQGRKYREQVRAYLDKTGREELSSEEIERDLETIFDNPASAQRILSNRLSQLDRDSIKAMLAAHDSMDESKAEKVLSAYDKILSKFANNTSDSSSGSATPNLPARRSKAEQRVQQWFDRMQRPELRYRDLKNDFMAILNDPSMAPQVLSKRLSRMDEKTVRALLTNNDQIDEKDIDQYMAKFEEAKADLLDRINKMQAEAEKRINELKHMAFEEAEAVRATAASAAWWLFVSALASAGAAALAGALASNLI